MVSITLVVSCGFGLFVAVLAPPLFVFGYVAGLVASIILFLLHYMENMED